jgi:hypothetical protein
VYTLYDKSFIKELLGTNLFTGAVYVLIVTGILLSFLSFLGCAGAVKEVKCMLLTVSKINLDRRTSRSDPALIHQGKKGGKKEEKN